MEVLYLPNLSINQTSFHIIMSDLQGLIKQTQQYILLKGKGILTNHKKKLIAGVLLLIAGYVIKKKMTMAHLITIIQTISKFIQYLPLPDSPKLRQLTPYEHPTSIPLRAIMNGVKIQEFKSRITKNEATLDDLKDAVFTGATLTIVLYNINSFYFVVQNKYHQEFKQLKATEQFDEAMYTIRKHFADEIPRIFAEIQLTIQHELNKIELQEAYNLQQISQIIEQLTRKVFQNKFYANQQQKKSIIGKSQKDVINLFTTAFEYSPQKTSSSIILRAAGGILSFLGGSLRVFDWFPEAKQEASSQRFDFIRKAYLMSALKVDIDNIKWPNEASKNLFDLVFEQAKYMLLSLNFSVLLAEHCKYNKQIFINRIHLWLNSKSFTSVKTVKILSIIFKILKEQFFQDNVYQMRDSYHEKELKKNIKQAAFAEQIENTEEIGIEESILAEIEGKKAYQYLEKEFELKYFNERSGVVHRPKKHESESHQSRDMQKMLSMLSGGQVINQHE